MKNLFLLAFSLLLGTAFLCNPVGAQQPPTTPGDYQIGERLQPVQPGKSGDYQKIDWDDLVPADWLSQEWLDSLNVDDFEDDDPRAMELLNTILEKWNEAPVLEEFDGRRVRIAGFVVPLEGDDRNIHEFLLVPYFGACIHVPPPPANQIIHVLPAKPIPSQWLMMPVWVQGKMEVERLDSDMGSAGYRIQASRVEEFMDASTY